MSFPADDTAPLLEARGLCCARGGRRLFAGLSFALRGGEWLQVAGKNGSGKTTLLRALCGLREADRGKILWRGIPIRRAAEDYFADLAFTGHRDGLKPKLTPAENLRAWAEARGERETAVAAALESVGMSRAAAVPCANLSAGQRRRTALARMLLVPLRVWILDEPLAALDEDGREMVSRILAKHLRRGGVAVVATHQPLGGEPPGPRILNLGI